MSFTEEHWGTLFRIYDNLIDLNHNLQIFNNINVEHADEPVSDKKHTYSEGYVKKFIEFVPQSTSHPSDNTCIICLDNLDTNNTGKLLCGHTFHFNCIVTWLQNKITCPVCRHTILSK